MQALYASDGRQIDYITYAVYRIRIMPTSSGLKHMAKRFYERLSHHSSQPDVYSELSLLYTNILLFSASCRFHRLRWQNLKLTVPWLHRSCKLHVGIIHTTSPVFTDDPTNAGASPRYSTTGL